ncbi:MAG: hypothetical protein ACTSRY_04010, partial [Alphaproteobacteria bacterium]
RASLHTTEELSAARAEGHAEGAKSGRAEALAERDAHVATTLAALAEALAIVGTAQDAANRRVAEDALALTAALMRKVLPRMAARDGLDEIEALLRETLEAAIDEPRIVIRVAEPVLDDMRRRIDGVASDAAFPGQLVLIGEPDLAIGDCRLEWADGGAERNGSALWEQIDAALARVDPGAGGAAEARPDSEPKPTTAQEAV